MRFASKSPGFNRTVLQPIFTLVQGPGGPEQHATRQPIMAQFEQEGLTPHERAQCVSRFTFLGQYEGEDPLRRVSIYDTDYEAVKNEWDAETKRLVEQNLLEGVGEWYFLLEEKRADKPWPSYDSQTPKQILETVAVTGADIEAVIVYERENKNRSTLITELETKLKVEEPEPLIAA